MIGRVVNALALMLRVQWRSFFVHVYFVLALVTIAAFRFAIPPEYWQCALPVVLFAEPGMLGLTMVAAQSFYERSEHSVTALAVTPLRTGEYVAALVLTSSTFAMLFGVGVQAAVLGVDLRLLWLALPLLLTALLTGLLGLALSTYFREFTRFLVGGLFPAMLLIEAPIISFFGLAPRLGLAWIPSDPALFAIGEAVSAAPSLQRYALYCALLTAYAFGAYLWASWAFQHRVRERLESL